MGNKQKLSLFLAIIILITFLPFSASAINVGDKLGDVLNTNIKTYIDGYRIPCFNIKNKCVVLIKDLRNYGFDVEYDYNKNISTVMRNFDKKFTPITTFNENDKPAGTSAFAYVYTNITALINGKKVESFNVQDNLAIYFSDLGEYGTFAWDSKESESRLMLYSKSEVWSNGYNWDRRAVFSIDRNVKFNGDYSIKIDNQKHGDASVEKLFKVEKNTQYKFSAMVKYSGYQPSAEVGNQISGASVGISLSYEHSQFVSSGEWTKVEYIFNSGDRTEVLLCLRNGMFSLSCKGTAWFSDIKLEKDISEPTTAWNILVVIYQNIDADVFENGKIIKRHKDSLNSEVIDALKNAIKKLPDSLKDISGNLMSVKKMDVFVETKPIKKISGNYTNLGKYIEPYEDISESLNEYLKNGNYNQIIVVSPLVGLVAPESEGIWTGLGGTFYNGIGFCQINASSDKVWWWTHYKTFPDSGIVHEILHCLESSSRNFKSQTAKLHGNAIYGFTDDSDGWRAWYTAYMQNKLKDGNGLDPRVYSVYNDNIKYQLISNDIKVGGNILIN